MLAQLALDQEADDQEADDQEALLQEALDQEADDQLALLQEADDQLALLHDAAFHAGSAAAAEAQRAESKLFSFVAGSVATNRLSPAFGFANPLAAMPAATFRVPTPRAPAEL